MEGASEEDARLLKLGVTNCMRGDELVDLNIGDVRTRGKFMGLFVSGSKTDAACKGHTTWWPCICGEADQELICPACALEAARKAAERRGKSKK